MDNTFGELSDQELACVYLALSGMFRTGDAHFWLHDPRKERPRYPMGPLGVSFPLPAGPQSNALFRLGRSLHSEVEKRGRVRIATYLPEDFHWAFESWESFCNELADAYESGPRRALR